MSRRMLHGETGNLQANERKVFARTVAMLALPILINALIDSAVDMADTFMLGFISQEALSATALANNIIAVANNFFFGLCTGAGILIAQYWGKKDHGAIKRSYGIALRVALAVGFLISAVAVLLPDGLMRIFTDEANLIAEGSKYLRIVGVCNLLNAYSRVYVAAQRSMERAVIGTVANTTSLLLNVVLNACFIFGIGPFPALGIVGVALATVISRVAGIAVCLYDAMRRDCVVRLGFKELFVRDKVLSRDFARYTLPALGNDLAWSLGNSVFAAILGHMGAAVVADSPPCDSSDLTVRVLPFRVSTVQPFSAFALTRTSMSASPVTAVCNAAAVIVGKKLGENELETARVYGRRFLRLSVAVGLISVLIIGAAVPLMLAFPGLQADTAEYLRFMLIFSMPMMLSQAINRMLLDAVLRSGGDTLYGLWLGLAITWGTCALGGCILAFVLHAPPMIIYMWVCMDEIVKVPCTVYRYRKGRWVTNITREMA